MRLHKSIATAVIGVAALLFAAPAFAAFNYSVNYSDTVQNATYPAITRIDTTSSLSYFDVTPGGSSTGNGTPSNLGLFTLTPRSTDLAGSGVFSVATTQSHYTATFTLQTTTDLTGNVPFGDPATFSLSGDITGSFGPDADNTQVTVLSPFTGLVPVNGELLASVTAGGISYEIRFDSTRNPGVIGAGGNNGGVTLDIVALPGVVFVPEPASLSLFGLSIVGLLVRRRK